MRGFLVALLFVFTSSAYAAASTPAPSVTAPPVADAVRGEKRFKAICGSCHSIDPAKKTIGPHMKGVIGRKAGAVDGFNYSAAMKAAGWTWDVARLDPWLAQPAKVVQGTKMINVLSNPKDRADIIAYLATVR